MVLLQKWYPDFLNEIEDQLGLDIGSIKVPDPRNYVTRNTFDDTLGQDVPRIVVISPGIVGTPIQYGYGQIRATWRIGVGIATADKDEAIARMNAEIYGAAAREIMLKYGGEALGGKVHWLDEQYVPMPIQDQIAQYVAASLWFTVDLENVANRRGGPTEPNQAPYSYGTADIVDITLTKE